MAKRPRKPFTFKNTQGVEYEIIFRKPDERHFGEADGICADPNGSESPKIHIHPELTKYMELNTIVHEMTHAFFWDKSEKEVTKFANTVAKFLYRNQNWRKIEK